MKVILKGNKLYLINTAWFNFTKKRCRRNGLFEFSDWKLNKYLIKPKSLFYLVGHSRIVALANTDFDSEGTKDDSTDSAHCVFYANTMFVFYLKRLCFDFSL